jgi:hypothetical protein
MWSCTTHPRSGAATPENRQNRSVWNSAICPQGVSLTAFSAKVQKAPAQALGRGRSEYWQYRRRNPSRLARSLAVSKRTTPHAPSGVNPCKPLPMGMQSTMQPVSLSICVRNGLSNCLSGFLNSYRLPFMFVTETVSFFDTTAAPPSYGAGRPNSAIPMSGFADRIECSAPTAACFRTINAPWPTCCAPVSPCANRKSTLSGRTARVASRSLISSQSSIAMEPLSAPSTASRT